MPAVEVNTLPADGDYDQRRQMALFKLWLLLTTNEITVNEDTSIFDTTAEASAFAATQADRPEDVYYVDLEKLKSGLDPLLSDEIAQVFALLQNKVAQPFLLQSAHLFWQQGQVLLGYGKVGCTPMSAVLSIPNPS
jgi:hypothetical protein